MGHRCRDCNHFDLKKKKEKRTCWYDGVSPDDKICENFNLSKGIPKGKKKDKEEKGSKKKGKRHCGECGHFDLKKKKERPSCGWENVTAKDLACNAFVDGDLEIPVLIYKHGVGNYKVISSVLGKGDSQRVIIDFKRGREVVASLSGLDGNSIEDFRGYFLCLVSALQDHNLILEGFETWDEIKARKSCSLLDATFLKEYFKDYGKLYRKVDGEESPCPVCIRREPSAVFTDGVFSWPGIFRHIVVDHLGKPSKEFLEHVRKIIGKKHAKDKDKRLGHRIPLAKPPEEEGDALLSTPEEIAKSKPPEKPKEKKKRVPEKKAPEKKVPEKKKPEKKVPEKKAPEKKAPEKKVPEKKAPEKKKPEKKAPEKKAPEKKVPEKKAPEKKKPEKKVPEKKAPEKKPKPKKPAKKCGYPKCKHYKEGIETYCSNECAADHLASALDESLKKKGDNDGSDSATVLEG